MLVRRLVRESIGKTILYFLLLEGNLLLAILFYPDFRENIPVWIRIAPSQVLKELVDLLASGGYVAYFVAQHFFKAANTLGTAAAALFAMGAVAREVENRTVEYLLSRPISRTRILLTKFAVGGAALTLPVFVASATAVPLSRLVGETLPLGPTLLASAHASLFLLAIYAAAFALSAVSSDQGRVAFPVLGLTTLSFSLYLVKEATRFSLYRLSDVPVYLDLYAQSALPLGLDAKLLAVTGAFLFGADLAFRRRDF